MQTEWQNATVLMYPSSQSVKDIFFLLLTSSFEFANDQKSVLSFAKRQIKQKIFSKIALLKKKRKRGRVFFILNNVNADPL